MSAPPPPTGVPAEQPALARRAGVEPRRGEALHVNLDGYAGPTDRLLDMARRHRIDLGPISVTSLANQVAAALELSRGAAPLERQGAWVVHASWLVLLKSRLLLPAPLEDARTEPAGNPAHRGDHAAAMGAAADWLEGRPRLGRDAFARGGKPRTPKPGFAVLLEAALVVFRGSAGRPEEQVYRPAPLHLWRVADALALVRTVLARVPGGGTLALFLPRVAGGAPDRDVRARAAVASTFVASLELARDGTAGLEQEIPFGPITLQAVQSAATCGAGSAS